MNFNFDILTQIDWQSMNTWLPLLLGLALGWLLQFVIDVLFFRNQNGRLKTENMDLHRQIDTISNDRNRYKKQIDAADQRVNFAESEAGRLRDDLEGITTERNRIQSELSVTNKRMRQLGEVDHDNPELRRRAEQAETRLRALEGDLATEKTRSLEAIEHLDTLKLQRAQLQEQLKASETQLSQRPTVGAEADTVIQDRLKSTEVELTRLSDENDRIRNELENAKTAASKLTDVEAERTTLLQRLQNADDEIAQLKSSATNAAPIGAAGAVAGGAAATLFGKSEHNDLMERLERTETERITEYNKRVEAEVRIGDLENSLNEQRLQAQHLEEKISVLDTDTTSSMINQDDSGLQVQLDAANSRIAALQGEVNELRKREVVSSDNESFVANDVLQRHIPMGGDDFLKIDGIGHVFARRLHESGINTFQQLSDVAPAEIEQIVQPQSWQIIDASDWIRQASELIGGQA